MSNTDRPLVFGFVPLRYAWALIWGIAALWFVTQILDASNVWPEPPETINTAFMAVLAPLVGGLMQARKDQGPPAEIRERDRLEQAEREPDNA